MAALAGLVWEKINNAVFFPYPRHSLPTLLTPPPPSTRTYTTAGSTSWDRADAVLPSLFPNLLFSPMPKLPSPQVASAFCLALSRWSHVWYCWCWSIMFPFHNCWTTCINRCTLGQCMLIQNTGWYSHNLLIKTPTSNPTNKLRWHSINVYLYSIIDYS